VVQSRGRAQPGASRIIAQPFLNYVSIVAASYERMIELFESGEYHGKDWHQYNDTPLAQATIAVTFAATALESYIYNYAARKFGENFTQKHIDALSHESKWLIVPRMVSGREVRADHPAAAALRALIKARNAVVHLKARNFRSYDEVQSTADSSRNQRQMIVQAALDAFRCIAMLGDLLLEHDAEEHFAKMLSQLKNAAPQRVARYVATPEEPGAPSESPVETSETGDANQSNELPKTDGG
jgi:hypothetical protein